VISCGTELFAGQLKGQPQVAFALMLIKFWYVLFYMACIHNYCQSHEMLPFFAHRITLMVLLALSMCGCAATEKRACTACLLSGMQQTCCGVMR
jgi:hypothetical protein